MYKSCHWHNPKPCSAMDEPVHAMINYAVEAFGGIESGDIDHAADQDQADRQAADASGY